MDFSLSDIQTMLLDSAERLLGEHAGVEYWRAQRANPDGFDRARWAQFAELGWLALPMPEAAGGLEGTVEDVALVNIALGKALATEPYVSSVVLAGHILTGAASGRSEQLLAEIAAGGRLVALAHQESGSDPLAADGSTTVARRMGDGFEMSGVKLLALDAPSADSLIVSARIEGEDGTALFLLDRDTPGVTLDAYALVDGTRAADVRFEAVALAGDALLAGGNAGAEMLAEAVDRASVALMAQAVGAMEKCLEVCGGYVKERKQFGAPIGSFQAIQHIMADMFVAAHQARSMLYHAVAHAGEPPEVRAAALSAARIVIGEAGQLVARNGVQVHGGYGLTDEYAVSHYYRRLMALEKQHGDLDRHVRRFGDHVFRA